MANIPMEIKITLDDEVKQRLQDFVTAVYYLMPDKDRAKVLGHVIDSTPTEEIKKLTDEMIGNG